MSDPDICIYCKHLWRAGHSSACPQETRVYPATAAEDSIVCGACHGGLGEHWTLSDDLIVCLGCAAHQAIHGTGVIR